ncbi:MAG TPA: DinB family protein [Chryseosolibacter sp.]
MKTETEKILSLLKRTFERGAWHGPSVKEALKDVDRELALKRIGNTHSIIELVAHMTSWRLYVINRLQGNNSYVVSDSMNFPKRDDWQNVLAELDNSQQQLLALIETFPVYKLSELVPVSEQNYTYNTLLNGIIHHDVYHAGQIMLIRRAMEVGSLEAAG